ncbi:MAG: hypothetical protein ACOWWR_01895 [Eubacteriales bacterium]
MGKKAENNKKKKSRKRKRWIIFITIWTFILTISFNIISEILLQNNFILISFLLLISIVSMGIFSDMIGIAVASADLTPFNAMASNKVKGSKEAVQIVKNASQVSSFCNDVVGDICGIISGATSISIAYEILTYTNLMESAMVIVVLNGFVAAFTVGGKAMGKNIALENNTEIVFRFGFILSVVKGFVGK